MLLPVLRSYRPTLPWPEQLQQLVVTTRAVSHLKNKNRNCNPKGIDYKVLIRCVLKLWFGASKRVFSDICLVLIIPNSAKTCTMLFNSFLLTPIVNFNLNREVGITAQAAVAAIQGAGGHEMRMWDP